MSDLHLLKTQLTWEELNTIDEVLDTVLMHTQKQIDYWQTITIGSELEQGIRDSAIKSWTKDKNKYEAVQRTIETMIDETN